MAARPIALSGGRQRRHTSIHPDREVGQSESPNTNTGPYTKGNPLSDNIIFVYEQLGEIGFLARDSGTALFRFQKIILRHQKQLNWFPTYRFEMIGIDNGIKSTVDEISCGVTSCLPFIRSMLQNQLLQSAKILNEVYIKLKLEPI